MIINNRRCPWCGNTLPSKPYFRFSLDRFSHKCKVCNHSSSVEGIFNFIFILGLIIIFFITIWIPILVEIRIVVYVLLFLMLMIYDIKTPMVRISNGKWYENISDILIGTATVRWYSKKENGIILPKIRIWNNYILPICFVDSTENPISQVICVRFNKVKGFDKVELYKISDSISICNLNYGIKFYIFNENIKIGEGIILK